MIVPSIKVAKIYKMLEIDTTIISSYLNSTTKYKSLFVYSYDLNIHRTIIKEMI